MNEVDPSGWIALTWAVMAQSPQVHTAFRKNLQKLDIPDLNFEKPYLLGESLRFNPKGSVRFDAVYGALDKRLGSFGA